MFARDHILKGQEVEVEGFPEARVKVRREETGHLMIVALKVDLLKVIITSLCLKIPGPSLSVKPA